MRRRSSLLIETTARIAEAAYVFHMSQLHKCSPDPSHVIKPNLTLCNFKKTCPKKHNQLRFWTRGRKNSVENSTLGENPLGKSQDIRSNLGTRTIVASPLPT